MLATKISRAALGHVLPVLNIHRHRSLGLGIRAFAGSPASDAVKAAQKLPSKLLINGDWIPSVSGKTLPVYDPRTEELVINVAAADKRDVDKAVAAARKAFDEGPWPKMTAKARGRILYKLADLIDQHNMELALLETLDNGKPLNISKMVDVPFAANHLRYFAGWADKISGKTLAVDGPLWAYTLHEPVGVVGQIIPWNFPLLMAAWKVAPALACGNTIVLKVAEQTPMTAMRLGQLALEAGLPPGVLNILTGYGPDAGAPLASHPHVDKVAFTGSTEVGRLVGKMAAENITACTLELGGKSPVIVDKSVDVDEVLSAVSSGLFFNAGQCCAAGSRTYVHASIYDEFVEKSVKAAAGRSVGDPFGRVDQGPQVDQDQFDKIMTYINVGQEQGAKLRAGGKRVGSKGFYIEPTVFTDVKDSMRISREEIFGPVQCLTKYETLDEVLKRANDTNYGLASGIFSNDVNVINTLSRGLRAGTVWVNCYNVYDDAVPFGGYKQSGIGRDKGEYALQHYTTVKAVYQKLNNPAWR